MQEKKSKKKKDKKEKKEAREKGGEAPSDTSTPPRGDPARSSLPSAPREGRREGGYPDRRGREVDARESGRGGSRGKDDVRERDRREGYRRQSGRDDGRGQHRRDDRERSGR